MRMSMKRFARLSNAFSKKLENHCHALALYFVYYNFVRVHKTLRVSPAMEAGVSDHVWTIEEMVVQLPDGHRLGRVDVNPVRCPNGLEKFTGIRFAHKFPTSKWLRDSLLRIKYVAARTRFVPFSPGLATSLTVQNERAQHRICSRVPRSHRSHAIPR